METTPKKGAHLWPGSGAIHPTERIPVASVRGKESITKITKTVGTSEEIAVDKRGKREDNAVSSQELAERITWDMFVFKATPSSILFSEHFNQTVGRKNNTTEAKQIDKTVEPAVISVSSKCLRSPR